MPKSISRLLRNARSHSFVIFVQADWAGYVSAIEPRCGLGIVVYAVNAVVPALARDSVVEVRRGKLVFRREDEYRIKSTRVVR